MSETIDELIECLQTRFAAAEHEARRYQKEAEMIAAEIRGVKSAQNLLTFKAEPPKQPRPYRDIKALVREYLARPRTFSIPEGADDQASFIAEQIGCRPDQVKKALQALQEGGR